MNLKEHGLLGSIAILIIIFGITTSEQTVMQTLTESGMETIQTILSMMWVTWWALVLGFSIAGAVEAWVSKDRISNLLQGHDPKTIGLASFFGFISSSCSYSAIATSKNLFKKGASAASSLGAFMFASTNLVIEIGFVILILLSWQFVVANFVGGFILITIMAIGFAYIVPNSIIESARQYVQNTDTIKVRDPICGMEVNPNESEHSLTQNGKTYHFCSSSCKSSFNPQQEKDTIIGQATSKKGWIALADKQWKEWGMLWDEILIGFLFAGLIAGFIPESVWTSVFGGAILSIPTYIIWTSILGALIGIATFVCSVGNVPFGAILWINGLPFGAVLSYIYADLIVPPIVRAYNEYYGLKFASVLTVMIFVSAVTSGVLTHFIFATTGLIPLRETAQVAELSIEADYKLVLNLLATVAFLVLYWLHRQGGHEGHQHNH